jgi:glycosyltransferase involved in cell wall biosynthesis
MQSEADVLLFPSMHEDAGWVVAEAAASGLPAVALDRGGPPLLGAAVVRPGAPSETVERLADWLTTETSRERPAASDFGLEGRTVQLREMLHQRGVVLSGKPPREVTLG